MIPLEYRGVMASWVLDRSIGLLITQYLSVRPQIARSEVGTIGDENHSSTSKHSPEDTADSQDGNDPDNQVDAADFPHDPARGSDMAVFTEELRVSRDKRLWLVIFNGEQFSSYARDGYPPFTWRPYPGKDQHTGHAHVEVNDYYNDTLTPWKVDMPLSTEDLVAIWTHDLINGPNKEEAYKVLLRAALQATTASAQATEANARTVDIEETLQAVVRTLEILVEKVDGLENPVATVDMESMKALLLSDEVRQALD